MSADKNHDLVHFACARELTLDFGRAEEDVLLYAGEAVVLLVETRGEHEASEKGFYTCWFHRDVREVLEAREQEGRGCRSVGCVLGDDAGVFAGSAGGD
jgi:hypothetical protein